MKRIASSAAFLLLGLAGLLGPGARPAAALPCSPLIAGDGVVVYGETRGTGNLGICVRGPFAMVFHNVPGCNLGTPLGDFFQFTGTAAFAGVTVIGPVVAPVNCGGTWVDPFLPGFQFGMRFTGLTGMDIAYGTPNRDYLWGNDAIPAVPDGAPDTLCGYADDDMLVGDLEPSPPAPRACLNGGPHLGGGDQCDNGDRINCELMGGYGGPVIGDCGCGAAPPEIWY